MMLRKYLDRAMKNDHAISPVIGTILMIAATVIIAGAVYAAVNIYGGKSAKQNVDAAWKAQVLDSNSDGLDDTIKVTYLSGPDSVTLGAPSLTVSVKNAAGTAQAANSTMPGTWSPGDFATWYPHVGAATYYVTVTQGGNTVLDQTLLTRQ